MISGDILICFLRELFLDIFNLLRFLKLINSVDYACIFETIALHNDIVVTGLNHGIGIGYTDCFTVNQSVGWTA